MSNIALFWTATVFKFVLVAVVFLSSFSTWGQEAIYMDSLEKVYKAGVSSPDEEMHVLELLSKRNSDAEIEKQLRYSNDLILVATENDAPLYLYKGYLLNGNAWVFKNEYSDALSSYFKGAEIAIEQEWDSLLGKIQIPIADVYSLMGNHENAVSYYNEAVEILRRYSDTSSQLNLAKALLNAGDEYFNQTKYDKALAYFDESGKIFARYDFPTGTAYNLGNMGMIYAEQKQNELARENIQEAVRILEDSEDFQAISIYLGYMADIYANQGDLVRALSYANYSLELAHKYSLKDEISTAHLKLSELYEAVGDSKASLGHYKDHVAMRDSILNLESVQEAEAERTNFEIAQRETELDLVNERQRNQRNMLWAAIIVAGLLSLLAYGLYRRNTFIQKTKKIIEEEQQRSEALLLNILPAQTAAELKERGKVTARKFESASVLFTDFVGFTKYTEFLDPEVLVERMDYYYANFDAIIEEYGLEKIKTIGDAYMCAAGIPEPDPQHAVKMVKAAQEILDFVAKAKAHKDEDEVCFDIRIGINSGPLVAGVVGTKKFAYDIWGDTVNVAGRMESSSEPGRITISESTYQLVKDQFECEPRGEISIKNHGSVKTYFVIKTLSWSIHDETQRITESS